MAVYDSLTVEDKNRVLNNSLHFIDSRLDTLKYELSNLEGGVKSFTVTNDAYDIESQSKMYMTVLKQTR